MALSLKDLRSDNKTFEMDFGGGKTLNITYNPNLISADMLTDMNLGVSETCVIMSELIVDWDLLDDAGNKIKPTEDFFKSVGLGFINPVLEAIFNNAFPKAESTPSSVTTRRRGQR